MSTPHISLCITNYNRFELLIKSFERVIDDERINEIIIVDDCSDIEIINTITDKLFSLNRNKILIFINFKRVGVYENKKRAIELASNERVIILDSDNQISTPYIDKLYEQRPWVRKTILAPDFARPSFNYTSLSGQVITKGNVRWLLTRNKIAGTMLNTMNYFVNREEYLSCWIPNDKVNIADSIYFNMIWLEAGNKIKVVEGLQYYHLVHAGSNYKQGESQIGQITTNEVEQMLMQMK